MTRDRLSLLVEDDAPTPKITRGRPHVRNTRAHPYPYHVPTVRRAVYGVPASTLPSQTILPGQGNGMRGSPRVWLAEPDLFRVPTVVELHQDDDRWNDAALAADGVVQKMGGSMLGDQGTLHIMVAASDPMADAIKSSCAAALKGAPQGFGSLLFTLIFTLIFTLRK